jgi:hypothetical protein
VDKIKQFIVVSRYQLFLVLSFIASASTHGQSLHDDIQEIYNFEPHKLSRQEQEPKSKLMDGFWKKVTENKDKYLDELRTELKDPNNPAFFLYDGGHLLLSLTKSKDDYQIALDAMTKGNLKDIDPADYIRTINFFAVNELNTTEAALKIVSEETFVAYIPQHAMSLDVGLSLRFMLLPINSDLYIKRVIEKLKLVKDTKTTIYLLNFLLYTCTCEGDSVIQEYSEDKNQDDSVREQAAQLVKKNKVKRSDSSSKYTDLVKKRREILSRVSDEALDELNDVSRKLKELYKCN